MTPSDPKPFDVYRFSAENLYQQLSNDRFAPAEVRDHPQAKYIFRYLRDPEMEARIILVEYEYTDRDYLDDYSAFYAKCFKNINRRCKRLHFFSANLSTGTFRRRLDAMIAGGKDDTITNSYLGFVVARPLPVTIIGRSLLKPYPSGNKTPRRKYITVKEKAHISGVEFPIESLAFQEQDHTLAACATVSLWTCFHKTGEKFHTRVMTPAEITQIANEAVQTNRPIPSDGLTVDQIIYAISRNCLSGETIEIKKDISLRSILYAYLHYGLPVILGLHIHEWDADHAIAITGYSMDDKPGVNLIDEVPELVNPIPFSSSRIDRFFTHDDEMGPYSKLLIGPLDKLYEQVVYEACQNKKEKADLLKKAQNAAKHGSAFLPLPPPVMEGIPFILWRIPEDRDGNNSAVENQPLRFIPYVALIPLYHKIRVNVQDIQEWVIALSSWMTDVKCLEQADPRYLEWDVYLTDQTELKASLQNALSYNKSLLIEKRKQLHPRFIWRATLKYGNDALIDLLGDATDIGGSANPFYDVLFHNKELEWKFREMYPASTRESGERVIAKQLDGFFYQFFADHPA